MTRRRAGLALAALVAGAAVLIAVELDLGAVDYGRSVTKDACTARSDFAGSGIDGAIQRTVLSGLYGAACELGTTREELVLSFAPAAGTRAVRWDSQTIERALRAGMLQALDDSSLPEPVESVLRAIVEHAPLDLLVGGGITVADIIEQIGEIVGAVRE